jgi:hypothetical protein
MTGFRSKRVASRERYADMETMDHLIDLRKRLSDAEMQRDNALTVLMDLRRENARLIQMVDHVVKSDK